MSDLEKDIEEGLKGSIYTRQSSLLEHLANLIVLRNYLIEKLLTFDRHSEDEIIVYNRTYFQKRLELVNDKLLTIEPQLNYKDL